MLTSAGVQNVLQVLECFSSHEVMALADLHRETGLSGGLLLTLLGPLEERGYIRKDLRGLYSLSPEAPLSPVQRGTERRQGLSPVRSTRLGGHVFGVVDHGGIVRHVSEGFLRFWKYNDSSEVVGRPSLDFWHERENAATAKATLDETSNWRGTLVARRSDGHAVPVDVSMVDVRRDDGPLCRVFYISPQADPHEGESSWCREGDGVWMPDLLSRSFLHDLNNLWAVITGNISLLKLELGGADEVDEMFVDTEVACQSAFKLIHRLFDSPGAGMERWQKLAPRELLESAVRAGLSGSRLIRNFNFAGDVHRIFCDEAEMFRALLNVVVNARQAMEDSGQLDVSAENVLVREGEKRSLAAGSYVKITISDSGVGMSEESLRRIFTPYFTTKEKGTGLGLFVFVTIIQKHRGHVEVVSKEGEGTSFSMYLPAAE